jgi:hypothetical protein
VNDKINFTLVTKETPSKSATKRLLGICVSRRSLAVIRHSLQIMYNCSHQERRPTSDPTLLMSQKQLSGANQSVIDGIIADCDLLSHVSGKKYPSRAIADDKNSEALSTPPKKRPTVAPEDVEVWRGHRFLSLEDEMTQTAAQQGCVELDCQANYWQLALEKERNRVKTLERSEDKLKVRLIDSQKKIRSHRVSKRQMGIPQEIRIAALQGPVEGMKDQGNDQCLALEQVRKSHEELKREHDNQQAAVSKLRTQVAEYKRLVAVYSGEADRLTDDRIKASLENMFHQIRSIAVRLCRGAGFGECL